EDTHDQQGSGGAEEVAALPDLGNRPVTLTIRAHGRLLVSREFFPGRVRRVEIQLAERPSSIRIFNLSSHRDATPCQGRSNRGDNFFTSQSLVRHTTIKHNSYWYPPDYHGFE